MVWFHGGGYTSGDSSSRLYGPEYLLDKDVILVTSNYRLGIFGFLTLGKILYLIFSSFVTLMLWFIWWGQLLHQLELVKNSVVIYLSINNFYDILSTDDIYQFSLIVVDFFKNSYQNSNLKIDDFGKIWPNLTWT